MINRNYASIAGQVALQRRLDTIANNVANAPTAGFRAEQFHMAASTSAEALPVTAFATASGTYLSRSAGEAVRTDSPFDVAIEGGAWLGVQTATGVAYSRDGRMKMMPSGELQTLTGHTVLDAGGSAILLDPAAGPPTIGRDGTISQAGRQTGVIGLFLIAPAAVLTRNLDVTVVPSIPAEPAVDSAAVGLRQGFMERSNVNPVTELSRLILDQRMFEALTAVMSETEQTMQSAIRTLGASN
jgi:flagellar basal-body rod protein FlgF